MITLTIDGLSTNGKTTLANKLAEKYNFKNFNTGAIYRIIALTLVENNRGIDDIDIVLESLKEQNIFLDGKKVFLNERDVSSLIRTEEVSVLSTKIAPIKAVKEFVIRYQQDFIKKNNTIMEGRDIGTRIAPNALIKFHLYSDFNKRVERKWLENTKVSMEEIEKNLKIMDEIELETGNYQVPVDAINIDTTNLTLEEVFDVMSVSIDERIAQFKR